MIKIEKIKHEKGYAFIINTAEGTFMITFAGNLDLYFNCKAEKNVLDASEEKIFVITKENYFLYALFNKLFEDIKSYNVYNNIINDEFLKKELEMDLKTKETDNPKRLFHDNMVDWHSDDYTFEESSRLLIKQMEDKIELVFKKGKTDSMSATFAIRICNSGSRYHPFNVLFMHLYNELINYKPTIHQIHIEEYLYQRKLTKKNHLK